MPSKVHEPFPAEGDTAGWEQTQKDAAEQNKAEVVSTAPRSVAIKSATSEGSVTAEQLKEMSFDQLAATFGVSTAVETIGTDQYGPILEHKEQLVGRPFLLVCWQFNDGDFGRFVTMHVLTKNDERFIVNDGSTGIRDQLMSLTAKTGQNGMVFCPNGLRVSEYQYTGPDDKPHQASTFYIDIRL